MGGLGGADEVDCVLALSLPPVSPLAPVSFPVVALVVVCGREVGVCLRGLDSWRLGAGGGGSDLNDLGHETAV